MAVAAALLLAAGCSSKEAAPPTVVSVQAATATEQPVTEQITGDAVLAPLAQAAIVPKVTAPVAKYFIQRGSRVKAGELLATLENKDLTAAAMDAGGAYAEAQASYQSAVKATIPESTQKAELDEEQAKTALDLQQKIYDARKSLFAQGAIPERDVQTAHAALVQAQSAYDIAQKHLASERAVNRAAAMESAKGQLESAEGKYKGAQAMVNYTEIRSPISGVVTERPLFPGETAAAGTPLLTVMDTSALIAKTHLPQSEVQQMKVGSDASVAVPGMDEPAKGTVSLISPALDPGSTTVEVWVRVPNAKGELRAGTPVHVSIAGRSFPHALVVPAGAVVTASSGKTMVLVVDAGSVAHQRVVQTGITSGSGDDAVVQIVSGLKAGEQVVSVGAYALDDGTKVKVVTAAEADQDADKPSAAKSGGDD
ncbi:efflux RND transporter periplasmic adaptor subunit [Paracidobacterium acidisoli]|uniref:efflux RND transporter periplasmic adaptor subunit n=1 Tax=Paracidobacterium acidisoli TaxID=2303751 RepID=UPI003315BD1B